MTEVPAFDMLVYQAVYLIPKGRVSTYKLIAEAIGHPHHSRAVGKALSQNPYAPQVPCHRVVGSDGKLGGFYGTSALNSPNVQRKRQMLADEGVFFPETCRIPRKHLESLVFAPRLE